MAIETEGAPSEASGTGLDENVAGALAYVLGLITGVIFLVVESDNRFVRFHAAQSIVLHVAFVGLWIVLTILQIALGAIPVIGDILSLLFLFAIWVIVGLGGFVLWLVLLYKAYSHEEFRLPIIGDVAANIAS